MAYEYRNQATDSVSYEDLVNESGSGSYKYDDQFVAVEDVNQVLDSIESDVSVIRELLDDIKGIDVISDAQYRLDELWKKL